MKTKILLALEPLLVVLGFLLPVTAFSHANLLGSSTLRPRDNGAPAANKTPMGITPTVANPGNTCGQNPTTGVLQSRTATQLVTNLQAGQTLTVNWLHTIDHPGFFQIWFSPNANDTGWVIVKDNIPKNVVGAFPRSYTTTITVPSQNCSQCAIRLIEVMTENVTTPSFYYSCANVTITPDGLPPPPPPPPTGSTGSGGSNCP